MNKQTQSGKQQNMQTHKNLHKNPHVIPGFGCTLGVVVTMLSLIVLIPLASVLVRSLQISPREFFSLIWKPNVRNAFWTSISCSFLAAVISGAVAGFTAFMGKMSVLGNVFRIGGLSVFDLIGVVLFVIASVICWLFIRKIEVRV